MCINIFKVFLIRIVPYNVNSFNFATILDISRKEEIEDYYNVYRLRCVQKI